MIHDLTYISISIYLTKVTINTDIQEDTLYLLRVFISPGIKDDIREFNKQVQNLVV